MAYSKEYSLRQSHAHCETKQTNNHAHHADVEHHVDDGFSSLTRMDRQWALEFYRHKEEQMRLLTKKQNRKKTRRRTKNKIPKKTKQKQSIQNLKKYALTTIRLVRLTVNPSFFITLKRNRRDKFCSSDVSNHHVNM